MKIALYTALALATSWFILFLAQFEGVLSYELYLIIRMVLGLIGIAIISILLIFRKYNDENKMKNDKFIN